MSDTAILLKPPFTPTVLRLLPIVIAGKRASVSNEHTPVNPGLRWLDGRN